MGKRYNKKSFDDPTYYDKLAPVLIYAPSDEPVPYSEEPTKAKLWARHAWFSGKYTPAEIAEAIEVNTETVRRWIRGSQATKGWAKEKESADKRIISRVVKHNSERIRHVLEKMLTVMEASAEELIENRHKLSVSEFGQFVNAFEKLFKTRQLEMGRPTEISENSGDISYTALMKRMEEVDIPEYKAVVEVTSDK